MKKLLSIIVVAFATSFLFTSCTEEEVVPSSQVTITGQEQDPF